jgi:phage terminase large subunit-like protein
MAKGGRPRKSLEEIKRAGLYKDSVHGRRQRRKPAKQQQFSKAALPSDKDIRRWCRDAIPDYNPWKDSAGYRWNIHKARDVVRFFHEDLHHAKGPKARQPFELEPWEIAIVANLYGWRVDGDPDTRRYSHALIYVPRKNGKTPLAAGIILYELFYGGDQGAEIYGAAKEYKQACLVFSHAHVFVLQCPELLKRCQGGKGIHKGQTKSIILGEEDLFSVYRPICADDDAAQGFNANAVVVDELHTQPDGKLVAALETALSGRENTLFVSITTADYDRPGSVCNETRDYAVKVREGTIPDPRFLPVIFEATREDDWTDPQVWYRANPNLGICKRLDYMEAQCEKAKRNPAKLNTFLRFDLNIITQSHTRWLTKEAWDKCGYAGFDPSPVDEGRECFGGLDLASTRDLTAFVLVWPRNDGQYDIYPWFWCPEEQIRREWEDGRDYYKRWADAGLLRVTPGNMTDYDRVRKDINDLAEQYPIQRIAVDRMFQGAQLGAQLEGDGFDVKAFGQGYLSMTAPTKAFDGLVYDSKLRHPKNPILDWMAANACIETDAADNWKPSKKVSTGKIDGIVAAIMATGLAMVGGPVAAPSIDWV